MSAIRLTVMAALLCVLNLSCACFPHRQCCSRCGCESATKRCRVTCETKKVPEVTYSTEHEDICMPGRSERCVGHGDGQCLDDGSGYAPTCGTVYHRKKLVKKTADVEQKSYKWVVETVCAQCRETGGSCEVPDSSEKK
ncbi:hypothetical protein [Planctomicrobium piriforme]|uniref:Uncharacterized protein n=1 Tax=Planctomicrobium piriforme TaxID=1576369 RepID=A0A1I3B669_9PLAN|nr:hypothetical protein [Planctomicrobium piriforme]SFH57710.1 hypothetical protein SAMN05421753_101258 [Planctomicrobium piriforme]